MPLFRSPWLSVATVVSAVLWSMSCPVVAAAGIWPFEAMSTESVPFRVDSPNHAVQTALRETLKITVKRARPRYDSIAEQARWPYWIGLENTSPQYDLHLTLLRRQVTNGLDRFAAEDAVPSGWQEFKLDMRRADLHVGKKNDPAVSSAAVSPTPTATAPAPPLSALWFPCAEQLGRPGTAIRRDWQGQYSVWRVYSGDVTWDPVGKGDPRDVRFAPVEISFWLDFELLEIESSFRAGPGGRDTARRAEWGLVSRVCESCRAVILCESLRQPDPLLSKGPLVFQKPDVEEPQVRGPHVHVVVGLEKRSVSVDSSVADQKRTVFCTTWTHQSGHRIPVDPTDSTEEGWPGATPYLTFHHSLPVSRLTPGLWKVEARTGEAAYAAQTWTESSCSKTVWTGEFTVQGLDGIQ